MLKPAALLLSPLLGFVVWTAYHEGWMAPRTSTSAVEPVGPNTEPPVAEYREVHSGIRGETGRLLTIDRSGRATLQTLPLGPESKTMRTHLSCAELVDFPEAMKMEFREFRSDYGRNAPIDAEGQEEISMVDRWDGAEKRVVWHNAPSSPKPPEGSWAHVVVYFEDIMRRAEEDTGQAREKSRENAIVYGESSSGIVGTYNYSREVLGLALAICVRWKNFRSPTSARSPCLWRIDAMSRFNAMSHCYTEAKQQFASHTFGRTDSHAKNHVLITRMVINI